MNLFSRGVISKCVSQPRLIEPNPWRNGVMEILKAQVGGKFVAVKLMVCDVDTHSVHDEIHSINRGEDSIKRGPYSQNRSDGPKRST